MLPGSHKWGLLPHYLSVGQIDKAAAATSEVGSGYSVEESARFGEVRMATDAGGEHSSAMDCPVPLGGALLIHERLLHSSTPNRTDDVR